jgi:hypothetical protein
MGGWIEYVRREILDGGVGETPAGGPNSGDRDVEGDRVEPESRDVFGVGPEARTNDECSPPLTPDGARVCPLDEHGVGRSSIPRHHGFAVFGRGIQALEPSGGILEGE